jgi:cell division protein FtsW
MLGFAQIDYQKLRRFTYPALFSVTGLMLLSVIGFGHTSGGAARWLSLGPVHIQPSEAAKLALILWLAYSLAKKQGQVKSFSIGFLPHVAMAAALMLLCLQQPDFGGAVVLLLLTFALLFVAGARVSYWLALSAAGVLAAAWLVRFKAYHWERMLAWLHMEDHRQDLAYQPFQSIMGFGSGQWTGMGLGHGLQILYLPKAHTDFIGAVIGEEFGFIGFACLCLAYLMIVLRGVRAALNAEDEYSSYIAFGISALLGLQALINLSVAMAILPTKGLTLPFLSYLPVLTGVTLEALAKDRRDSIARLATGLSVLEHYDRLPVSRVQRAQEVNLAPDGSVVLVVGTRRVSLHLGQGPWPKKLLMVAEVMRQFERERELPGVVFLDNELHPERVVVRMR